MTATSSPSASPSARDLADAFIRHCAPSGDPIQQGTMRAIVLAAGELIASRGHAGRWAALDPAELLASIHTASPREHTELCYYLLALVTWLAANHHLHIDCLFTAAAAILASDSTDPLLIALCHSLAADPIHG